MTTFRKFLVLLILRMVCSPINSPAQSFTRITSGELVTVPMDAHATGWGDFDNDGRFDLFVGASSGSSFLYRNGGSDQFTRIPIEAATANGGAWGDYDNDGFLDLFIANRFGINNVLYRNAGNGTFIKIRTGPVVNDRGNSSGSAWGDFDNDGYLDLFVANVSNENDFLYRNNRDGSFSKINAGPIVTDGTDSTSGSWGDYDNDGDLDLFVANGADQNNMLFRNDGRGSFTRIISGGVVNDRGFSTSGAWGDYDNDGWLDLFVVNRGQRSFLYRNNRNGTFTRIVEGPLVNDIGTSNGCTWWDYDNDGDLDLFVTNMDNQNNFQYENKGGGSFSKITGINIVSDRGNSVGCASGDYNNDGFPDLFVANLGNQVPFLYRNQGNNNHWIIVKCVGFTSNRSAIGTKVSVKALIGGASRWQLREIGGGNGWSSSSLNAEFGLADAAIVDSIQVQWPSGAVQELGRVRANQILLVEEPAGLVLPISNSVTVSEGHPGVFRSPNGGFVDSSGNVFVADLGHHRVVKITQAGLIQVLAGTGTAGFADGPSSTAQFNFPIGVVADNKGNVFVADAENHRIRKISAELIVSTIAGSGQPGHRDGPAATAQFNFPNDLAVNAAGNLYVSEFLNHRIRQISASGEVSTLAGSGEAGYQDGPALKAKFDHPGGIALDKQGNLFVTDYKGHRIRKIATNGEVSLVAGNGTAGYRDAKGLDAAFNTPDGIVADENGNLFVADSGNHAIRVILPDGQVRTVAGTGQPGNAPGSGSVAQFNQPSGIGLDQNGNLYVADTGNQLVRRISIVPPLQGILVRRKIPEFYSPGIKFTVTLEVQPPPQAGVFAIEDQPPLGWIVTATGPEGAFDPSQHKVKFGPFFDSQPRTLSYEVQPAFDNRIQFFSGSISIDGSTTAIAASRIDFAPLHPADNDPPDNRLSIKEITAYASAWRRGNTWPIAPNPIPIDYVTRAGTLWKLGEFYRFNREIALPPLWWVSTNLVRLSTVTLQTINKTAVDPGTIQCRVPERFVPTEPLRIVIEVKPQSDVAAYAVQDRPPAGWPVQSISEGGLFDSVTVQVKWGPFLDNRPRLFIYEVIPPQTARGIVQFEGLASFDGNNRAISGNRSSTSSSRLFKSYASVDSQIEWTILGEPNQIYQVEASTNLMNWIQVLIVTNVNGRIKFTDPEATLFPQRYYRSVRP